jgi:hypothetical protein
LHRRGPCLPPSRTQRNCRRSVPNAATTVDHHFGQRGLGFRYADGGGPRNPSATFLRVRRNSPSFDKHAAILATPSEPLRRLPLIPLDANTLDQAKDQVQRCHRISGRSRSFKPIARARQIFWIAVCETLQDKAREFHAGPAVAGVGGNPQPERAPEGQVAEFAQTLKARF